MSRKMEITLGLIILLVVLAFFGYKFANDVLDLETGIDKLDKAIASEDIDYLKDHIEIAGLDRELDREEVEEIVEILKDFSVHSLKEEEEDPGANVYLVKKSRSKLLSDNYGIALRPYDLIIGANPAGTEIMIDGEKLGSFEEGEDFIYENLLPGRHRVQLSYKGDYENIDMEEEVLAFKRKGSKEIYLTLEIPSRYAYVSSNLEEASLVVNGEDTGINIYEPYKMGPIVGEDIVIAARATIDGETYQSQDYNLGMSNVKTVKLEIDYEPGLADEEIFRRIEELIDGYEKALVKAVNQGSYSYLERYIEDGSPFMQTQQQLVENLYKEGTSEKLLSYEIEDIDIISKNEVLARVSENHLISYKSGEEKEVNNRWTYTIVVYNDSYLIRHLK